MIHPWSLNEDEQKGLWDFLEGNQEKRDFMILLKDHTVLILLKTLLLGKKDLFFGKEALLLFEEMCQKSVSELHPQCLRRRGMLAQVQWGWQNQRKSLIATLQINVTLQVVEVSVCFFKWLLNLGVGTLGGIQTIKCGYQFFKKDWWGQWQFTVMRL